MDIIMTEKRLEQIQSVDHMRRLPHAITQILTGRKQASSIPPYNLWVARHRDVRLNERSMEPMFETDGDETMMDHHKQERRPCFDKKGNELDIANGICSRSNRVLGFVSQHCVHLLMQGLSYGQLMHTRSCCWRLAYCM